MKFIKAAFLMQLFITVKAFSCSVPPDDYFLEPEEMVARATSIVLAEAIAITEHNSRPDLKKVEFKKILVLKGSTEDKFQLPALDEESIDGDFKLHSDDRFWEYAMTGNGVPTGDCHAYAIYNIGKQYLILFGLNHTKAYEQINSVEKDKWFRFVNKHIKKHGKA